MSTIMSGAHPIEGKERLRLRRRVERWLERESHRAPHPRDRHLFTGLDGERYLFDTQSGLPIQLLGPAEFFLKALLTAPEHGTETALEAASLYDPEYLREALEQCSAILEILRRERRVPISRELQRPGYNLSLNAGMACNLACTYCDPLGYREKTRGQVMSRQTAQKALDFFFSQVPEDQVGCVTYSIGGEPLLYRKLLEFVAAYTRSLRERGIKATQYLNTNGMLLTDGAIEYLRVSEIDFGISLDGPREAHDANRILPSGEGTYDRVLPAAQKALSELPYTSISAVITAAFPRPLEIYQHLLGLGFQRIIVKPVRGRPDQAFAFTPANLHHLQDGYRDYARYFADQLAAGRREIYTAINPHDYFARFLLRVFLRHKNAYRCGAASLANLTVAPDGSFYPCEGFVGQEEYRLGHVETGFDEAAMERFARLHVDDRSGCQDCWARYQCGGGCYLQGVMLNNDIAMPDPAECELTRFLVELAIWTLCSVGARRPSALAELRQWCDQEGWLGPATLTSRITSASAVGLELPMVG